MAQPGRQARPTFSQPIRQIFLMLMVIVLSGCGAFLVLPKVLPVFQANPWLNGFILMVFAIGVIACFWQVLQLIGSVRWIEHFVSGEITDTVRPPRILAPLASMLRSRESRMQLGSSSTRSILDSVATRIDELREITRYIVNLLIFLGLLGTFYGLATTVPAVVDTIRSLAPNPGEASTDIFNRLMTGLEGQLGGMGVAFASSLLGLAGSLIVGLLELFAGHGQNRFYRELEEWLSSITRVGFAGGEEGAGSAGVLGVMLEQMNDNMTALQDMFAHSDASRAQVDDKLGTLADAVAQMTERLDRRDQSAEALARVADGQERLVDLLTQQGSMAGEGIDAESRMRLRSIDVQMLRILEEMAAGRQESLSELRRDIDILVRALAPQPGNGARALRAGRSRGEGDG
ncbi:MAG: biopolymer transporter ExbB [Rhodobacteraceae bacterium]|nr:biopolymer transporter ExbB [Paracoccaceae bacterium]QEW21718.1 hypothetical protein LA6_003930 [Marinibacterium anthonyi]